MKEYIISDGRNYIKLNISGNYEFTSNPMIAETFSADKAANFVNNHIPKRTRKKMGIIEFNNGVLGDFILLYPPGDAKNTAVIKKKRVNKKRTGKTVKKAEIPDLASKDKEKNKKSPRKISKDIKSSNKTETQTVIYENPETAEEKQYITFWFKKINASKNIRAEAIKRKNELTLLQQELEYYKCDIDHYTEFFNLNCYQGYKVEKIQQNFQRIRRQIKEELGIIDCILRIYNDKLNEQLTTLCRHIIDEKKHTYIPRRLTSLFTDGIGDESTINQINEFYEQCKKQGITV